MDRPLHGGPVSPWPRRSRRLVRWCAGALSTIALTAVVMMVALMCADALGVRGPMVASLALLISIVLLYALAGLTPLTVALACALMVVVASHWLGLDLLVVLSAIFERIVR